MEITGNLPRMIYFIQKIWQRQFLSSNWGIKECRELENIASDYFSKRIQSVISKLKTDDDFGFVKPINTL